MYKISIERRVDDEPWEWQVIYLIELVISHTQLALEHNLKNHG
jgi:hypothetical protein